MELNSTQETDDDGATADTTVHAGIISDEGTPAQKKTTIMVFVGTTKRLTKRKRGNDTYDDVINRDLDTLIKTESRHR
jgi:hypothetical protein